MLPYGLWHFSSTCQLARQKIAIHFSNKVRYEDTDLTFQFAPNVVVDDGGEERMESVDCTYKLTIMAHKLTITSESASKRFNEPANQVASSRCRNRQFNWPTCATLRIRNMRFGDNFVVIFSLLSGSLVSWWS